MERDPDDPIAHGDRVSIFFAGEEVHGMVQLASPNGASLMLAFDGVLGGYVGWLPVLREDDGVYYDLIQRRPVAIKPLGTPWPVDKPEGSA